VVERQHQTTVVSGVRDQPIGGGCLASFCHDPVLSYKILAPLFPSLSCAIIHFPRFSLSVVSLVQASPRFCLISDPISHFRILFRATAAACARSITRFLELQQIS
jgi:hypothetical protein